MSNIFFSLRIVVSKGFFVAACGVLLWSLMCSAAESTSFSQRKRLEVSGGYDFGQQSNSHYYEPYGAPDTSTLLYTRDRIGGRVAFSWSGFWKQDAGRQGLYLRSVPAAFGGGSVRGNLSDRDFCDGSQMLVEISKTWRCPQELTMWSDSDSFVRNWFVGAEVDNGAGFFLQSRRNDERFFGAGFSFGYLFLHENDLAQGLIYNTYLPPDPNNSRPIGELLRGGENVIGNKVFWHALKVGVEVWSEQIPPRWHQPIILKLAVHYIPYASFRGEDSHFLRVGTTRDDLAPVPNIISTGMGQGAEVKGSLFVPFPTKRPLQWGLLLQARWQRLFLKQGYDTFLFGDGSSIVTPLTRFTTESFSVSTGLSLTW